MTVTANPIPENRPGSGEFYATAGQFERDILRFRGDPKTIREDRSKVPAGYYYKDGRANEQFRAYLAGIAYARSLVNFTL